MRSLSVLASITTLKPWRLLLLILPLLGLAAARLKVITSDKLLGLPRLRGGGGGTIALLFWELGGVRGGKLGLTGDGGVKFGSGTGLLTTG